MRFGNWRRLWSAETGIFLALWLMLMIGGRDRLFRDPGTLWHTRLGQMMLDGRQLVRGDPFSFTGEALGRGEAWLPHQWLGECLMALLFRLGGWDALQLAAVTTLAGLYAWVAHRLIRGGLHWSLAAAATALVLAAGSSHFHVRPHLATMVFLGLTFARLIDFEAGRKGLRSLCWLVPIYALWTNLHGGLLGGLLTMGLALAGWLAWRRVGWGSPLASRGRAALFGLLVLACGLTAFVNPYGWRLPAVWLDIMGQKGLTEVIQEHSPLDPAKPEGVMVLVLAAAYLAVLVAVCSRRRPRVTWLLPLVWLYLACTRIRHASLFGITAGLAVAEMIPETPWVESLVRRGSDLFDAARGRAARAGGVLSLLVPAATVLGALALKAGAVAVPVVGAGWARLDANVCPADLAEVLARCPEGTPVFNELNFGGCLIWFAPNVRVFADDRAELYGEQFLLDYDRAQRDPSRTGAFLRRFRYDLALTRTASGYDAYFRRPDSGWVPEQTTETATLYRRVP